MKLNEIGINVEGINICIYKFMAKKRFERVQLCCKNKYFFLFFNIFHKVNGIFKNVLYESFTIKISLFNYAVYFFTKNSKISKI